MGNGKVVGLGLCVLDHLYVVEDPQLTAARTRYSERIETCGGMVATALAQAAQLGCEAHLLSLVGADADGRTLRRSLTVMGVTTRRTVLSREFATTVAVVLVARRGGARRFLVPDRRSLERGAPDFDLSPIRANSVLLVDGHFPAQALRAVRRAREVGATIVADFSRPRGAALRLLPFVNFPVLPQEFADAWAGGDARRTIRELADRFGGAPVFTQGQRGGLFLDGARIRRYPAQRVTVRDTTGAGDVFHGAFAAGLAGGRGIADAVALAARAAAQCCTALGGTGRLLAPTTRRSRAGAGARPGPGGASRRPRRR